ncbi:MAG TPA: NAD(P)-binding domain-containing protein [Candidatus Limnocylindrales bacterium]|nr:NAD(P)-binding domain-containing protein [Candidatus Limnocylindrales bacterium]
MRSENVVIIGAGQAGLATSYFLTQSSVDHVILEAGRVAETWRSRRWDSFCLVTPNWSVKLPGGVYDGPEPDGFMSREALVDHFQRWSDSFHAPVQEDSAVTALDADGDTFVVTTPAGKLLAKTVVVASGGYQRAHLPPNADQIPKGVTQLLAEEYSNPSALEPGAVLIIGSGQTGCQLAEDLHLAGRKVIVSCGRCPWAPRRMGGHDLVWWLAETGFWQRTMAQLPSPAARLFGNPQNTGRDGGHDLNYRTLHAAGIELVGRYIGADGNKIRLADDLAQSIQAGDDMSRALMKWVEALCEKRGMPVPWEVPPPPGFTGRTELDVRGDDITTVIWTSGYRPAYDWVHLPVCDDMGFPIQVDGQSSVPGLYFMGVHFMRKAQSAVLYGVGEDAEVVATDIARNQRPIPAFGGTSP